MKIAIDVSQAVYGTGVAVYTQELVSNLLKIDRENEYVIFGGSLRRVDELKAMGAKVIPLSPTLADLLWNKLHILKVERFIGKMDVFHSSDWTQPPSDAYKVTTVHDLAPLKYPKLTHPKIVEVHKRRLYWVLKECDKIIVPSNATKKDLIELGGKEEKIVVIPEAAGNVFKKTSEKSKFSDDYILTIGSGGRKNTDNLIAAFEKIKRNNLKLVIVGNKNPKLDDIRGVIQTGFVTDQELTNLYSNAKALIYPSLYEGFGLPIIQAFASGCPVVTSNISSMPEVAGDAAVLVDPNDVASIINGIEEVLRKPKEYIKKGLKRAKEFSWERTARETLAVYRKEI